MSEPSNDGDHNEPWLDMSVYANLPPEDAVDERVLDTLRTVLRAPEVTPPPADAWDRAVHTAVTGGQAGPEHDAAAGHGVSHQGGQDAAGHDAPGHGDPGHGDPGHDGHAQEDGWPAGHEAGSGALGGQGVLGGPGDGPDSHGPHDAGSHW